MEFVFVRHGWSLVELALSGVYREGEATVHKIAPWFNASSAGMPKLRALTQNMHVNEEAAASVAQQSPDLTELNAFSKPYSNACTAFRLAELPALSRLCLCWSAGPTAPAVGPGLAALVGGRTFDKLQGSRMDGEEVVTAVMAAAAVSHDFDLNLCRTLGDKDLLRLLDGTPAGLDKVHRLWVRLGSYATWERLRLLNRLGYLTYLTIKFFVSHAHRDFSPPRMGLLVQPKLRDWPVAGLHGLVASSSHTTRVHGEWVIILLVGIAASGSQHTLQELSLRGPGLSEATAAASLAALSSLLYSNYTVEGPHSVFDSERSVARDRMAALLHRRLPSLRHTLGRRRRPIFGPNGR